MDASYKFFAFAGMLPRRVRDAEGGAHAPVRSADRRAARSSPTRREYFVRNHRPAGARPAIAHAGPYTYGGDPVNYVDPAGLWSMGLGIVIGWNKSNGWSVGVGAAADVGGSKGSSYNTSYTWNQDGSNSFSLGASGSVQLAYFPIAMNFGGGYSYNSYSGHTLGVDGSACVGTKEVDDYAACAGVEAGGSEYWDGYGNYLGATAYAGAFAELSSGDDEVLKVSSGYEAGFLGMEGRGVYAGVSAGADGGSLYAQWSENGGWSYGFGQSFEAWRYESSANASSLNLFGIEAVSLETQSIILGLGTNDALSQYQDGLIDEAYRYLLTNPLEFSFVGHFASEEGNIDLPVGFYDYVDQETKIHEGYHSIEQVASRFSSGANGFDGSKDIRMYSCSLAKYGGAAKFSKLVPNYNFWAATNDIAVTRKQLNLLGVKTRYYRATILNGGTWQMYRNGSLVK